MKVLVIGCTGFVGRHLVAHLAARGHALEGWSRSATADERGSRAPHDPRDSPLTSHRLDRFIGEASDFTVYDKDGNVVKIEEPRVLRRVDLLRPADIADLRGPWDAAVHLAAHAVPGAAWDAQRAAENLALVSNVAAHLARVQPGLRLVFMSSAHVYAPSTAPHKEHDPLAPRSPYGASKLACEEWLRAHAGALDVRIARSFNQIGPGMAAGLLVPDLLAAIARGTGPLHLKGNDSTRDFLDVRDGVAAIEALAGLDDAGDGVFNVCSGVPATVGTLARGLMQRLDCPRELVFGSQAAETLVGDPAKLRAACGWRPRISLDETLDSIVAGVHS